ncbi:FecCD family ABC transporter permease [Corallococcus llansteffanensis]|uniref:Iron ABC transporter permease n=1 Tax=Corallococcus llansteffanensis TaxID=2316731 RepID=A0A3A8NBX3_9BACT|nr:iron ABC transporter permease [Corallococcus llansteffanensis]RKH41857.1 iron ABC transporter permease [Corallococcus llansteffanensis]
MPLFQPDAVRFTPSRAFFLLVLLGGLCLGAFALAVRFGEHPISLRVALTDPASTDASIFWSLRLPRAVLAALIGAALASSGAVLQALLRNPLADPFVLGVSGGAALGASLAIAAGLGTVSELISGAQLGAFAYVSAQSFFAFIGSVGAVLFVLVIGRVRAGGSPYASLLSGVIFNSFAVALITLIRTLVTQDKAGEILFWLAGALGYESAGTLLGMGLLQVLAIAVMWIWSGQLNLLTLGDDDAASLGVPVQRVRVILFLATSVSVAGSVALAGMIGFVGLIVPHILRALLGPDLRLLIPCSALGGAVFVLGSDLLARLLFPVFDAELPVGVITALLGCPFFLSLLGKQEGQPERP